MGACYQFILMPPPVFNFLKAILPLISNIYICDFANA